MGDADSSRFRVVIAGGGVAGLTLANALEVRRAALTPPSGKAQDLTPDSKPVSTMSCWNAVTRSLLKSAPPLAYFPAPLV